MFHVVMASVFSDGNTMKTSSHCSLDIYFPYTIFDRMKYQTPTIHPLATISEKVQFFNDLLSPNKPQLSRAIGSTPIARQFVKAGAAASSKLPSHWPHSANDVTSASQVFQRRASWIALQDDGSDSDWIYDDSEPLSPDNALNQSFFTDMSPVSVGKRPAYPLQEKSWSLGGQPLKLVDNQRVGVVLDIDNYDNEDNKGQCVPKTSLHLRPVSARH